MKMAYAEPGGQWIITPEQADDLPMYAIVELFAGPDGARIKAIGPQMNFGAAWMGPPEYQDRLWHGCTYRVRWPDPYRMSAEGRFELAKHDRDGEGAA